LLSGNWDSGIDYVELTDVGLRRSNNQDSSACVPATTRERFSSHGHLFIVADGMGAHAAGEKASRMATEKIPMHYFRSSVPRSADALRTAVMEANSEIHQQGQSNPEFHNMGTTASSLAILPAGAVVAHVGDSRVYRLRQGVLEQLTFDHSLVWEMEASGHGDSGIWGSAIPRNVITRSLGPSSSVEVDVEGPFPIEAGDCFLLCSDGLSGLVKDAEIGTLMDCLSEKQAARVLVDLANLRGGPDNITVLIVRARDGSPFVPAAVTASDRPTEPRVVPLLTGTAIGCFLLAALLGGLALGGQTQMVGVMVVMLILGAIASGFAFAQHRDSQRKRPRTSTSVIGGGGPYRRYDAKPTEELYNRLGATVQELRDAARERKWAMNWSKVDHVQRQGQDALRANDPKNAIRYQAEAIIEAMNQLREQHNRAASETAIEY
jgi:protein phosphatase